MKKLIYIALDILAAMISWYLNHSIILLIIHVLFSPIYLIYCLLSGVFADGQFMIIMNHYF